MYHVISATKWGFKNRINNPIYLFNPRADVYYVAAEETMKSGILPKIFTVAGAVTIKRTWREAGKSIDRKVDTGDTENIGKALSDGIVITFPQGTTTPFKKGRKGTAHIIKQYRPVVLPVRVDGFRRGFDKQGMRIRKERRDLSLTIFKPLEIDYEDDVESILDQVMNAIGQTQEDLEVSDSDR